MYTIDVRNVNEALPRGLELLQIVGAVEQSRNGDVLVSPFPVTTQYFYPTERVLFSPLRDANPFFHLMEALWMLAGRNDVAWPAYFNKRFPEYSDDGVVLQGAYGHRWRQYFGQDQIFNIVKMLRKDPTTRRAVLQMWAPADLVADSKDLPCNTVIYFRLREGYLDMTVSNRSNDIYWGAYGANAVHMSILQEFVATAVDAKVGYYYQISNNFHLYLDVAAINTQAGRELMADDCRANNLYQARMMRPYKLMSTPDTYWMSDLSDFMRDPLNIPLMADPFFHEVAGPMFRAWYNRREGISDGYTEATRIIAEDWREACTAWIDRRQPK